MNLNIPTILTLFRIALIPVVILVFYSDWQWARPASSLIFGVAGATDLIDGYLARKWNQESALGAFLDPVADKLLVVVVLVLLVQVYPYWYIVLPSIIIIGREIVISALREWMAQVGKTDAVAVSMAGKVKTVAQLWALGFLLYEYELYGLPVFEIGLVLLILSAILAIHSMMEYILSARKALK